MDRERRYFISTTGTLNQSAPYNRLRWQQLDPEVNVQPERVELKIAHPEACETYYNVCGKLDQHNRNRQSTLGMERKLRTHDWATRVNLTVFGMIVVDTFLVWKEIRKLSDSRDVQKAFYTNLAEELIDNQEDSIGRRPRHSLNDDFVETESPAFCMLTGRPRSGVGVHLTPTKRRR